MLRTTSCKAMCRTILNWSTLFKSASLAIVVGTALTFANYGDVLMNPEELPCWWKVVLNFAIPFLAEVFLCLFLSFFLSRETDELLLHTAKQTTVMSDALPEIAVHSKPLEKSKSIKIQLHEFETTYESRHSRRHESCPVFAFPRSPFTDFDPTTLREEEGCVRTHRNGVSIYTVNELLEVEDCANIQPLPKEGVKFQYNKCKSMSCLNELQSRKGSLASSPSRETRKLQVFDNDLFFPQ